MCSCMYWYRCGSKSIICAWSGCKSWKRGWNVLARCWYSGWNLIVFCILYVVCLLLWSVGCALSKSGIGPGLGWISPHCNISRVCWVWCFIVMLRCGFLLGMRCWLCLMMWFCVRLSDMWEVGPDFIYVSPFIVGCAVLGHIEFRMIMAILGWKCVWVVWKGLPIQFFLSVGRTFQVTFSVLGNYNRRKLVHYNRPLWLGHCDSC